MYFTKILQFFWLRISQPQTDLVGKRFATLIVLTSIMSLVAGLTAPTLNLNIVLGAASLIVVGFFTLYAIRLGWGHWARPLMVAVLYLLLYASRVTNARPLMHADNSFMLILFVTLLLPYLMIERTRWLLQLAMVCCILLSLIGLDWSIAQFGRVYQPQPTAAIQYTRWVIAIICIVGSFTFFNKEILRAEQRNAQLLQQSNEQNAELAAQAEALLSLQDELLRSEKIKAMDRIIARVSHQINSPLGALYSAVQQSAELARAVVRDVSAGQVHDAHRRWLIEDMLQRATHGQLSNINLTSLRDRRALKASLVQQLQAQNPNLLLDDAVWHEWADALMQVQLPHPLPSPYLQAETRQHLELLIKMSAWVRNNWVEHNTVMALRSLSLNLRAALGGQLAERPSTKDVAASIQQTVAHFVAQHPGCQVQCHLPAEPALHLCVKSVLDNLLHNLLSNAADATAGQGQIVVTLHSTAAHVVVSVADDGPGVVPELQPMLFQPFFTTKERGLSMGLGLYVVRQVVEGQGGVMAYQRLDNRTVFSATLPWPQATEPITHSV